MGGQLKSDGNAVDVTMPAGNHEFGDLVHVDGWNGFVMEPVLTADTARATAIETSPSRIWLIDLKASTTAPRGTLLYWDPSTAGQADRNASRQIVVVANGPACALVEVAVNSDNVVGVRVLNNGGPTT